MKKLIAAVLMLSALTAGLFAEGTNFKAKKGKYSKVEPIYLHKLSATIDDENGKKVNVDGLLFYFEITKLKKDNKQFYLDELRDFKINGISYATLTKQEFGKNIEPHTIIIDSKQLIEKNPTAEKVVKNPETGIIMETVIYGVPLPEKGKISLTTKIGWKEVTLNGDSSDQGTLEDFNFDFDLSQF